MDDRRKDHAMIHLTCEINRDVAVGLVNINTLVDMMQGPTQFHTAHAY